MMMIDNTSRFFSWFNNWYYFIGDGCKPTNQPTDQKKHTCKHTNSIRFKNFFFHHFQLGSLVVVVVVRTKKNNFIQSNSDQKWYLCICVWVLLLLLLLLLSFVLEKNCCFDKTKHTDNRSTNRNKLLLFSLLFGWWDHP